MINVSETAAVKIGELLAEENKAGSGLRVFVQGGGCSGFQYGLMIEENGQGAGDQVYESHGVKLFVDPISIRYLTNAEVDFVDTVTGGGFTIRTRTPLPLATVPRSTSVTIMWGPASAGQSCFRFIVIPLLHEPPSPDFPAPARGGKRSSKRDRILNIFVRQEEA
jgi:iron-sulfur cluster assembly accessory protein